MKTVAVSALAVVALAGGPGCGAGAAPPLSNTAPPLANATSPAALVSPRRLEIVEGSPVTLADGIVVHVEHVGYAHLTGSRNLSNCTLFVVRDGERAELALVREHGAQHAKNPPGDAHGWRFTLEMADPYQQPARVVVEAEKL